MTDRDETPPDGETATVAGVTVPAPCADRIDEQALRAAVEILADHRVDRYEVSPSGGLKIHIGVHRPDRRYRALRAELEERSYGLREYGARDGFRRLRVDFVDG